MDPVEQITLDILAGNRNYDKILIEATIEFLRSGLSEKEAIEKATQFVESLKNEEVRIIESFKNPELRVFHEKMALSILYQQKDPL